MSKIRFFSQLLFPDVTLKGETIHSHSVRIILRGTYTNSYIITLFSFDKDSPSNGYATLPSTTVQQTFTKVTKCHTVLEFSPGHSYVTTLPRMAVCQEIGAVKKIYINICTQVVLSTYKMVHLALSLNLKSTKIGTCSQMEKYESTERLKKVCLCQGHKYSFFNYKIHT